MKPKWIKRKCAGCEVEFETIYEDICDGCSGDDDLDDDSELDDSELDDSDLDWNW